MANRVTRLGEISANSTEISATRVTRLCPVVTCKHFAPGNSVSYKPRSVLCPGKASNSVCRVTWLHINRPLKWLYYALKLYIQLLIIMHGNWWRIVLTSRIFSFSDNRRTAFAGEPYCNEMLQLKYRGMYHYVNEHPHHMHPEERVLCRNEEPPNKADSGISQNLQSFQREYESLMGKLNENCKLPPNEQTQMEALRHPFPGPHTAQRVRMTSASPEFYVNGTPITHGNLYDPRLTHERQKYLPMMLNSPLTLRRPCSVNPPVDYPYRSVCL